jgi:thioesterase domain-containing protein/acyl carrier protein
VEHVRNLYGPTEDTVYSTWTRVEPGSAQVLIGRSVANSTAYVLDGAGGPAPVGVPGELYLAGEGLARGYAGRPELTAERFLPCPWGPAGSRMYRTGDRVRRRADGELEYFGRMDFQVKVRGFRIELGEIESALEEHPGVRRAVVVAREARAGAPGDLRLVAYHVPQGAAADADGLRGWLRGRLPEYMLPSAFVALETLPLTGSGKTDRNRLPAPDFAGDAAEWVAPRTPAEETVARAFAEALGVPRAGARDDFFALGGHSLLAVRLVARIQRDTGVRIPLHALFAGGTVERLAALLGAGGGAAVRQPLVAIRAGGAGRPFFCVHAVDGHVLSYQALAEALGGDRPFYGVQAAGVDGGEPLGSVEEMAASYVAALRGAQPGGPYALGGWSMGAVVAWEAARQLRAAGERVDVLALIDAPRAVRAPDAEDETSFLEGALCELLGGRLPESHDGRFFRALCPGDRLEHVRREAVRAGALPADLDAARLGEMLRVRRAHLAALRAYVPGPFDGPALFIEAAERPSGPRGERALPWEELCGGGLWTHRLPGSHFTLLREPHVRRVADLLRDLLDRAETAQ